MKGIEAINVIILIILAIVTLLAVVLLFMGTINPAKSTSLQAATQTTCQKVNPAFCSENLADGPYAARMPVFDFDANHDGTLNEHDATAGYPYATAPADDNLASLCQNYYGCPSDASAEGDQTSWVSWRDCCLVKVCGCPSYA